MEKSLLDSGETTEIITTDKNEETVKDTLREVKSQDIDHGEAPVPEKVPPAYKRKVSVAEEERFLYKFSETKDVMVNKYQGKTSLLIGKKHVRKEKDAKFRGISFPTHQWSVFKKNFSAIEEAIKHFQLKNTTPNGNACEALDTRSSSTHGFSLIETWRFDGRSYLSWASEMELFLKQMKLAYVLSEPYPGIGSGSSQDWLRDDYLCHNDLMKSLSDDLYRQYLKRFKHAKELWEELKWVYRREESNSKMVQVRKYIDFKMVEERPVLEQVQEFIKIADSIVGAGMVLDETFYVSTIISKFPSSWSGFVTRLMEEEFLTVCMLVERLKAEEEFLRSGKKRVTVSAATGSSQIEMRPSLGTMHTGSQSVSSKRKEPERDIIPEEKAPKKPNQMTSSVAEFVDSETQAKNQH
ncbi:hypothetical protein AXX17_AT3G36830 [Arabidopsis thaliana]|uniref:Uncharacterized protein n=1 Tax=Arabidopsis thaliana TaxID=3702 RepID=A0A178V8G4_ARATH|nr:hypothetical protein AXX17_AT3G36830 [Arabidopsis thaliana]